MNITGKIVSRSAGRRLELWATILAPTGKRIRVHCTDPLMSRLLMDTSLNTAVTLTGEWVDGRLEIAPAIPTPLPQERLATCANCGAVIPDLLIEGSDTEEYLCTAEPCSRLHE